jgi:hypothetical protein
MLNQLDLALFNGRKPRTMLNGQDVVIRNLELRQGDVLTLA